jgi:hypothetical protein
MRWVAAGTLDAWQWDAFVAPIGTPLPALAAGEPRLTWAEVRPMLDDLAEELEAACSDGTLPPILEVDQVWVQPDGRVQLVEMPLAGSRKPQSVSEHDESRALRFLGEAAVTALEGHERPLDEGDSVRVPLPSHAWDLVNRFLGRGRPLSGVREARQELDATRDRPTVVGRWRRALHLGLMFFLMQFPMAAPVLFVLIPGGVVITTAFFSDEERENVQSAVNLSIMLTIFVAVWIGWAFLFRGGITFWITGIALRRQDGRQAGRFQCGLRAVLLIVPVWVLYIAALLIAVALPPWSWLYVPLWAAGTVLLLLNFTLALVYPTRSLCDRIVGTYLVPR